LASLDQPWPALSSLDQRWPALASLGQPLPALASLGQPWPAYDYNDEVDDDAADDVMIDLCCNVITESSSYCI